MLGDGNALLTKDVIVHAHDAISLLVFALGAFTIPLIAGRLGIPAAVGEILFGIAVGPYVLGLLQAPA